MSWKNILCRHPRIFNLQLRQFHHSTRVCKHYILGIETSCDETGAAVVDSEKNILSDVTHSQLQAHLDYGGIIPTIAKYLHKQHIESVVSNALSSSGLSLHDVDAIATTVKPGLKLSLAIGLAYSKELMKQSGKPLIPIHHMEAHALVVRLIHQVAFPFLVLLISGGHSQIAVVRSVTDFLLLGTTLDNSPGEVLDKVARRLKLKNIPECSSMSGGRAVEYVAKSGNPHRYPFSLPLGKYADCNFSFGGMKSQALGLIEKEEAAHGIEADGVIPTVVDFCASFQYAIASYLVKRLHRAMLFCERQNLVEENSKKVVISGGVASNQYIRSSISLLCDHLGYELLCPPPRLCTDNGVMIAWNGMEHLTVGTPMIYDPDKVDFQTACSLGKDITQTVRDADIKKLRFKLCNDEIMKMVDSIKVN